MNESELTLEQKKKIQRNLNRVLGGNVLVVDGLFGNSNSSTRKLIKNLQSYFRRIGIYDGESNGIWDENFNKAVSAYILGARHITLKKHGTVRFNLCDTNSIDKAFKKILDTGISVLAIDDKHIIDFTRKDAKLQWNQYARGQISALNTSDDGIFNRISNNFKNLHRRISSHVELTHKLMDNKTLTSPMDVVWYTFLSPFYDLYDEEDEVKLIDKALRVSDRSTAANLTAFSPQIPILTTDIARHQFFLIPYMDAIARPMTFTRTSTYTPKAQDFLRYITMQKAIELYGGNREKLKQDLENGKTITIPVSGNDYVDGYGSKQKGRTFGATHYITNIPRRVSVTTGSYIAQLSRDHLYFLPDEYDTNYKRNSEINFDFKNNFSGTIRDIHSALGSHSEDAPETKVYVNDFSLGFTPSMLDDVDMSVRIFDWLPLNLPEGMKDNPYYKKWQ